MNIFWCLLCVSLHCRHLSYVDSFTLVRILGGRCLLLPYRGGSTLREVKHVAQMLEMSQGSTPGLSEKRIILPFPLTLSC